jgi:4-hydroxyphenylpyruvate dioxygenase-like putative hemolysin
VAASFISLIHTVSGAFMTPISFEHADKVGESASILLDHLTRYGKRGNMKLWAGFYELFSVRESADGEATGSWIGYAVALSDRTIESLTMEVR